MEKTLLNTIVEERLTTMPSANSLKRHKRWIASHAATPIISSIFGTWINPHCHVLEAYDQKYLENLNK